MNEEQRKKILTDQLSKSFMQGTIAGFERALNIMVETIAAWRKQINEETEKE